MSSKYLTMTEVKELQIVNYDRKTVGEILRREDKVYSVSYFQRDYAWKKEHWDALYEDIRESLNGKRQHFFGFMTFFQPNETPNRLQIIEGQQRLATITILAAVVRDMLFEKNKTTMMEKVDERLINNREPYSDKLRGPKLELSDANTIFFKDHIQDIGKTQDKAKHSQNLNSSNRLIERCYSYFSKRLEKESPAKLVEFLTHADQNLVVMSGEVTDLNSAYIMFQTLNGRGLDLRLADLLKTHLLRKAGDNKWREAKRYWDHMVGLPGMDNMNIFLRQYWLSTTGTVREEDLFGEFSKKVNDEKEVFRKLKELREEAENYSALRIPESAEFEYEEKTAKILKDELYILSERQVMPLLMAAYSRLDAGQFSKLAGFLTTFIFRYLTIGERENKELERLFSEVARSIRKGKTVDASSILQELRKKDIEDDVFKRTFATKRFTQNRKAVYVLRKIEQLLEGTEGEFHPDITLEHILPLNPDVECRRYMEEKKMWEDKDELTYRLGNMTLLLKKPNRDAKNWIPMKKAEKIYSKATRLMITDEVKGIKDWTRKEIDKRQDRFARLALKIWRL